MSGLGIEPRHPNRRPACKLLHQLPWQRSTPSKCFLLQICDVLTQRHRLEVECTLKAVSILIVLPVSLSFRTRVQNFGATKVTCTIEFLPTLYIETWLKFFSRDSRPSI